MELLEYLRRQFAYDEWANREVLTAIRVSGSGPASSRPLQLLAHILSAEKLWLERLMQQPQSSPVWPEFGVDLCEVQTAQVSQLWHEFFERVTPSGLSEQITYQNSKGETWRSTVQDVLTHVMLHSAYHRGQIASLIRAGGDLPPYTDFIHATRQGLVDWK